MSFRDWHKRMGSFRVMDCNIIPLEEEVVRIATSDIAQQLMVEGVVVDNLIRAEIECQMRHNVSNLIAAPNNKQLSKRNLAKEALGLSNIVSLKLQARKKILQKKSEILTTKQRWFIVRPSDFKKLLWDILTVLLLTFSVFEVPFSLAFGVSGCTVNWIDNINLIVDCCFCLDCGLNFITAYIDKQTGIVVVDPSRIIKRQALTLADGVNIQAAHSAIVEHKHASVTTAGGREAGHPSFADQSPPPLAT
jgi:hypothetical protein